MLDFQIRKPTCRIILASLIIVLLSSNMRVQAEGKQPGLIERIIDKSAEANFLYTLGKEKLLSPSYSIDTVRQTFNNSLNLYREVGDQQSEADILTWLAEVKYGAYLDKAINYLKEAQDIYNKLNSEPGEKAAFKDVERAIKALTLYAEGRDNHNEKGYQYALKKYNEALKLVKEMGWKRNEGKLLDDIACIYANWIEHSKSFEYFNEALKAYEQVNDRGGMMLVLKRLGLFSRRWKDYSKAITNYERGFALSQDIGYRDGKIECATLIGDVYSDMVNYQMAHKYYKKALSIIRESGYQHKSDYELRKEDIFYKIGGMYSNMGDYKEALKAYNKSKYIYGSEDRSRERRAWGGLFPSLADSWQKHMAGIYRNLGETDRDLGNYPEAIENLQKSLEIYKEIEDGYSYFYQQNVFSILEDIYKILGDDKKVKEYGMKRKEKEKEYYGLKREEDEKIPSNIKRNQMYSLFDQGCYFMTENKYDKALDRFHQALEISKYIKDKEFERLCLSQSGNTYRVLKDFKNALKFQKQALEISREQIDKNGELSILLDIAGTYDYWLSDYPNALNYYEQALSIAEEIGSRPSESKCLTSMGFVYSYQNKYEKAEEYFKNTLKISKDMHAPMQILDAQGNLYELARLTGKTQKEKHYLGTVINTIESVREKISVEEYATSFFESNISVYSLMIALLLRLGEYEEAFDYVERAKSRALLDMLGNKVKLGKGKNKKLSEEERRLQKKINDLLEKIRKEQSRPVEKQKKILKKWKKELKKARKENAKFLLEIKEKDYEQYSLMSVNPLTLREVQELLEPDTTLLEYYVVSGNTIYEDHLCCWIVTKNDFELTAFPMKESELTSKMTDFRKKILTCQPDYEDEAEILYDYLIRSAKSYIKTKRICIVPHSELHFLPFQALLNVPEYGGFHMAVDKIDGMLTVLFVMEGTTAYKAGLKVGDKIVAIDETPTANMSLDEIFAKIYGEPSISILLELESEASRAKRAVRLEREIISKTSFFAELHKFNFPKQRDAKTKDIKSKSGSQSRFLIEEYDIFYAPSASILKFVLEKRKEVSGKVLAFGNPELEDESLNLPHAEEEVESIKESYPETSIYVKDKATEEKAKQLSGNYDIIHFASHGELNPQSPLFSCIKMAKEKDEDGRLEVHEIFNLDLENASLVTLSACETGLGKLSKGDELIGLTRGFVYAGTPSIVASLWEVNDKSTSDLMSLFYKNLKTHSKVEALRMAQLEMINGEVGRGIVRGVGGITTSNEGEDNPQTSRTVNGSHPYFWAPFILLGDWN